MTGPEGSPAVRRPVRLAVRAVLWALAPVLTIAAMRHGRSPGLAVLGFFAMAFVCWDAGFLLRRAWHVLRTPGETGPPVGPPAEEGARRPPLPSRAWASCEGRWVEVDLEPLAGGPATEAVDVVTESLGGRLVLCPSGERPPEPLEMVGMQAVFCRLEGGAYVQVRPLSGPNDT